MGNRLKIRQTEEKIEPRANCRPRLFQLRSSYRGATPKPSRLQVSTQRMKRNKRLKNIIAQRSHAGYRYKP